MKAPNPHNRFPITHREAVTMTRFWWNRYHDLPWWRPLARQEAYANAQRWGEYAKRLHEEPLLLASEDAQQSDHPPDPPPLPG